LAARRNFREDGYRVEDLNSRGDETTNAVAVTPPELLERVRNDLGLNASFDPTKPGWKSLVKFNNLMRSRGATVFVAWPGIAMNEAFRQSPYPDYFAKTADYMAANSIVALGKPQEFFIPVDEMYNTQYHPNARGRERRTNTLATLLCKRILCS
jgi:hypothetical protein